LDSKIIILRTATCLNLENSWSKVTVDNFMVQVVGRKERQRERKKERKKKVKED